MFQLNWKFGQLLEQEGITAYRLHKQLVSKDVSRATLYRWLKEPPKMLDLELAKNVLEGLEQMTGKHYRLSDLVEFESKEG